MSTAATEWQIQTVWTDDHGFEHCVNYPPEKAYNLQRSLTRQGREWTSCSIGVYPVVTDNTAIYPNGTIIVFDDFDHAQDEVGSSEFHND